MKTQCPDCGVESQFAYVQDCHERQNEAICSNCKKTQLVLTPASVASQPLSVPGSTLQLCEQSESAPSKASHVSSSATKRKEQAFKTINIPAGTEVGSGGEFDCHLIGLPKGSKQVLMERGLGDSLDKLPTHSSSKAIGCSQETAT